MKKQLDMERKLYTLCILVRDIPGVLSQVARLFSRKGYNIESIVSGETDRPGITRITIGILADQGMIEQIAAQCSKLLPVTAVKILDEDTSIRREIALVKVGAADRNARDEVIQLANIFRAKVIDVSREALMTRLWESDSFVDENTLTVNVGRLRRKLEAAGLPDLIRTRKGTGYLVED